MRTLGYFNIAIGLLGLLSGLLLLTVLPDSPMPDAAIATSMGVSIYAIVSGISFVIWGPRALRLVLDALRRIYARATGRLRRDPIRAAVLDASHDDISDVLGVVGTGHEDWPCSEMNDMTIEPYGPAVPGEHGETRMPVILEWLWREGDLGSCQHLPATAVLSTDPSGVPTLMDVVVDLDHGRIDRRL